MDVDGRYVPRAIDDRAARRPEKGEGDEDPSQDALAALAQRGLPEQRAAGRRLRVGMRVKVGVGCWWCWVLPGCNVPPSDPSRLPTFNSWTPSPFAEHIAPLVWGALHALSSRGRSGPFRW